MRYFEGRKKRPRTDVPPRSCWEPTRNGKRISLGAQQLAGGALSGSAMGEPGSGMDIAFSFGKFAKSGGQPGISGPGG